MSQKRDERLTELAFTIADHQARIEKLGVKWAAQLVEKLDATEKRLLDEITAFAEKHKRGLTSATALADLSRLERKIAKIRNTAFAEAQQQTLDEAFELYENEQKWAKKLTKTLEPESAGALSVLPAKAMKENLAKMMISNMTVAEWFSGTAEADVSRIVDAVREGVRSGWTIPELTRKIMGTKANGYTDGIVETSRKHATTMARTLCGGIANNAKDEFYRENDDVVIGVEWLDTLDSRTCSRCGGLSRKRWKTKEPHPVPPLHHSCRCVLIPVTELTDLGEDVSRPAANADFDAEAKELYEKKYPGKKLDDLAASTRKKYFYEAQKEYTKRTGNPPYRQVPGNMTFSEYFGQMPENEKLRYLGPGKYEVWKNGKLPIEKFFPPYPERTYTVKELKEMDKKSFKAKPVDVPVASRPEFVPAKTIEEATEWTKANRGADVNWKGIDLANLNIINREMDSLSKDFPILGAKYKTVGSNGKMKCVAWANDELVEFSPKHINEDAIARVFESCKNRAVEIQKQITFYKEHSGFYGEKVSKREISKLEKRIKFSRFGVGDDWNDPEKYVRGVVAHETGHTILYRKAQKQREAAGKIKKTHQFRGEYETYKISLEETDAYIAVNDAFKKAKKTGDIFNVSEYGNTDMHEFFAETFTMYRFEKNKLPDYIVSMIERVAK